MDDDRRDLIVSLCTQVGMIMEEVSLIALDGRGDVNAIHARLDRLAVAVDDMALLVAAAQAVARGWS
ncbi:hypothetical protein [Sphingopyxis sp. KK2]|uniref:hypothetical protein n=1 Tax=Sphingopyxis sp. KK2 TaxID=1855727 RepID=UPI001181C0CF|nr:hypothetical protein [Sphingopyxis sp. KK2]